MLKKAILGLAVGVGLLAIAGTVFIGLKRDPTGRAQAEHDKAALSRSLEAEFGGQAQADFVCQFPVVGVAPCITGHSMDSREVRLTLAGSRIPEDTGPDDQAFRIAMLARQRSSFARTADRIQVIFQDGNLSRTYSFTGEELLARATPGADMTGPQKNRPSP